VNVAIIPARGGSKRIPRKNIRIFNGKPMISWSIEAAYNSGLFDKIVVSTDDREIKEIAEKNGALVPFIRPDELSNDYAGTIEVIAHAISALEKQGVNSDAVCCIYATAPFIRSEDLCLGLKTLESGPWEYTFAATEYAAPIFRSFYTLENGGVEMFFPEHFTTRSQDLPKALHDAGQFYWGKPESWREGKRIFGKYSHPIIIPRWRVQDIDTEDDWKRAEILASVIISDTKSSNL
jgi:N-acylneuraminate cytidylyltransferase